MAEKKETEDRLLDKLQALRTLLDMDFKLYLLVRKNGVDLLGLQSMKEYENSSEGDDSEPVKFPFDKQIKTVLEAKDAKKLNYLG